MSWRIVHIKEGDYLRLKLDNIEVSKNGDKIYIPLSDISVIILEGQRTTLTTRLLGKLSQYNIALVVCDTKYLPTGLYLSYGQYHRTAKRARQQLEMKASLKNELWKNIVQQKTRNQIDFAKFYGADEERIQLMEELYLEIQPGDFTNREGHIAKVYFNSLYGMGFTRDDECIENMAMNFGYTIIRTYMARLVVGNGLMTMIGIFHKGEYNQFNLVDDLMEPFRGIMDYWLYREILSNNGDPYLDYSKRLRIIDFMNQPMMDDGRKSTVDLVMAKYISSVVKVMEDEDVSALKKIKLSDFIAAEENRK